MESWQHDLSPPKHSLAADVNTLELITPRHQTRMKGPEVVVIYKQRSPDSPTESPNLLIDEVPQPWERQFGSDTWFARLILEAGLHRLQAADSDVDFFVETHDSTMQSPESWDKKHPHPDTNKTDRCFDCHKMADQPTDLLRAGQSRTIGAWKGAESCFACHGEEDHNALHFLKKIHLTTRQCTRCHSIH
jgi:hypothetical protein